MENLTELINHIKNPNTGETLVSENRIKNVEEKGDDIHITYNREGIEPAQKREVEKEILAALAKKFNEDNIFIFSSSEASKDIYNSLGVESEESSNAKPAELKVGHGSIGEKRKIPGVKNIIAIGSGKGGVGKSTVTSNIAITLAKMGHSVGIIDADIYGPSLPMLFNKRNKRPQASDDQRIIPLESYGIKFISFGSFIHEDEPVVWRGPMLGGVLNQFFFETNWGELDYLLVDLPPGTGDVQLSMAQNLEIDSAIIVSTPQDISLLDARKALHMFDKMNLHVLGMVENMSSFICDNCDKEHFIYGTGGVMTACNELGVGFLGSIPLELGIRKGADFGKPYMANEQLHEGSKTWEKYTEIGKRIDSYFHPSDNKKKGLMDKLFKK